MDLSHQSWCPSHLQTGTVPWNGHTWWTWPIPLRRKETHIMVTTHVHANICLHVVCLQQDAHTALELETVSVFNLIGHYMVLFLLIFRSPAKFCLWRVQPPEQWCLQSPAAPHRAAASSTVTARIQVTPSGDKMKKHCQQTKLFVRECNKARDNTSITHMSLQVNTKSFEVKETNTG